MKTVVMILGILLLGAMAYYGYSYGVEKSADLTMKKENNRVIEKVKSVDTEIVGEESISKNVETDIAVKSSIEEDIPAEEESEEIPEEALVEEDIIENEESNEENLPENIEEIIDEQEALMDEAVKEELEVKDDKEHNPYISKEEAMQKAEKEEAGVPILETAEEKIIREEEEKNRAAMAEDNVSE